MLKLEVPKLLNGATENDYIFPVDERVQFPFVVEFSFLLFSQIGEGVGDKELEITRILAVEGTEDQEAPVTWRKPTTGIEGRLGARVPISDDTKGLIFKCRDSAITVWFVPRAQTIAGVPQTDPLAGTEQDSGGVPQRTFAEGDSHTQPNEETHGYAPSGEMPDPRRAAPEPCKTPTPIERLLQHLTDLEMSIPKNAVSRMRSLEQDIERSGQDIQRFRRELTEATSSIELASRRYEAQITQLSSQTTILTQQDEAWRRYYEELFATIQEERQRFLKELREISGRYSQDLHEHLETAAVRITETEARINASIAEDQTRIEAKLAAHDSKMQALAAKCAEDLAAAEKKADEALRQTADEQTARIRADIAAASESEQRSIEAAGRHWADYLVETARRGKLPSPSVWPIVVFSAIGAMLAIGALASWLLGH
jgi:hypothetical protein